jgi:uncharacterized membrane protein
MTRIEFLETLERRLAGMPEAEIDDIVGDYAIHFEDGMAAGRSEMEIAKALGDPARLARELKAEAGFRRWEQARTPGNFGAAILGFLALVAVDFIFLLPLVAILALVLLLAGIAMIVVGVVGVVVLAKLFHYASLVGALSGVGMVASAIGGGALLLLLVDGLVRLLGRYARLHYSLLGRAHQA